MTISSLPDQPERCIALELFQCLTSSMLHTSWTFSAFRRSLTPLLTLPHNRHLHVGSGIVCYSNLPQAGSGPKGDVLAAVASFYDLQQILCLLGMLNSGDAHAVGSEALQEVPSENPDQQGRSTSKPSLAER